MRLFRLTAFALLTLLAAGRAAFAADESRPNVILIVIDTLRADHLGCYGYPRPITPQLDALAARSVVFERTISQAPWTAPSVASLFTAKPPSAHGAIGSVDVEKDRALLAADQVTLAERFQQAGYRTAGIVTNPNITAKLGFGQGFETFEERILAPAKVVTEWGIAQIAVDDSRPLFLYLHYMDPHSDYDPPKPFRERFQSGTPGRLKSRITTETLHAINFRGFKPTPEEMTYMISLYDGEIAYTDDEVGRFIDAVDARGWLGTSNLLTRLFRSGRKGVVAVTADHGEEFLDHGGVFHGFTVYRELTHVPLIIAAPGVHTRRVPQLTRTIDIAPTLLDLAGLEPATDVAGATLRPFFEADGAPERIAVTQAEMRTQFRKVKFEAIETPEWKYIHDFVADRTMLFHLTEDPHETAERSAGDPATVAALRQQLQQALAQTPAVAPASVTVDEQTRERLRQLGY